MKNVINPILVVDDDLICIKSIKRAFKDLKIDNALVFVNNGLEALEFLRNKKNAKPNLIFLDLNMPKMDGFEFLEIAKQEIDLKRIPIVILTTSKEEEDRVKGFDLSVAGYMIKPITYKEFLGVIKTIDDYWTVSEQAI